MPHIVRERNHDWNIEIPALDLSDSSNVDGIINFS